MLNNIIYAKVVDHQFVNVKTGVEIDFISGYITNITANYDEKFPKRKLIITLEKYGYKTILEIDIYDYRAYCFFQSMENINFHKMVKLTTRYCVFTRAYFAVFQSNKKIPHKYTLAQLDQSDNPSKSCTFFQTFAGATWYDPEFFRQKLEPIVKPIMITTIKKINHGV